MSCKKSPNLVTLVSIGTYFGLLGLAKELYGQWLWFSWLSGPRLKSSHRQLLLNQYFLLTVCRKEEKKEKEAVNGPFFKQNSTYDMT